MGRPGKEEEAEVLGPPAPYPRKDCTRLPIPDRRRTAQQRCCQMLRAGRGPRINARMSPALRLRTLQEMTNDRQVDSCAADQTAEEKFIFVHFSKNRRLILLADFCA
jgi:hypothetical protein